MKKALWSVLAGFLALVLVSCGGGGGDGGGGGPASDGSAPAYTIGGSVSNLNPASIGLTGTLVLGLTVGGAAAGDLALNSDGTFTFSGTVQSGQGYTVAIKSQPTAQTCAVSGGSGVASGNVTNVSVTCQWHRSVGGAVSGLNGVLRLLLAVDGAAPVRRRVDNDAVDPASFFFIKPFTFPAGLVPGQTYVVAVESNPIGQSCTVANGGGTVGSESVSNVSVSCTTTGVIPTYYSVGGTVSGPVGRLALAMQVDSDTSGAPFSISADGAFTLPHRVLAGQAYTVSVFSLSSGTDCTVVNGSGVITSGNVTNVSVVCTAT